MEPADKPMEAPVEHKEISRRRKKVKAVEMTEPAPVIMPTPTPTPTSVSMAAAPVPTTIGGTAKPDSGPIPAQEEPLIKEQKALSREERLRKLRGQKEADEKKAEAPRVRQVDITEEKSLERLTKFGGFSPLGRIVREESIKKMESTYQGRKQRLKPSGEEGIYAPTFQSKWMVWGRLGSQYSIPEEFCAYTMIEFVKYLLFETLTEKEKLDPEMEKLVYRMYAKYFDHAPAKEDTHRLFEDAKKLKMEQDPRLAPFQKFMFDYSSFRNSYLHFLTRDAQKFGIHGPRPAQIIVYNTFSNEKDAIDMYEDLKARGEDTERLFVSPIGALLPLNPSIMDQKVDVAQEDAAKMLNGIRRNMQMSHLYSQKNKTWAI